MGSVDRSAIDIAKWFVNQTIEDIENEEKNGEILGVEYITHLKLQKLLYYSQGCYLALEDKPLFKEPIEAWQHGPVVRDVYEVYEHYKGDWIRDKQKDIAMLDASEIALLRLVNKTFGKFSAWRLRDMTHEETPWRDTFDPAIKDKKIPLDKIADYFKKNVVKK